MARVSISKAAKLAGVSRSTLYTTYINKGALSVSSESDGKKYIETSELLRVFGSLASEDNTPPPPYTPDTVRKTTPRTPSDTMPDVVALELSHVREKLAVAEKQIKSFEGREHWYQEQMKTLTDTVKLLEDQREPLPSPRRWWEVWKQNP